MKKKLFLVVSFIAITLFLNAQDTVPSQPFIKLYSGKLILGSNLSIDDHFFKATLIRLDSFEIKSKEVSFYKDNSGILYGRMGRLTPAVYHSHNISIFQTIGSSTQDMPTASNHYSTAQRGGGVTTYFCKGLSPIKRLNATNLKGQLTDNPEANRLVILANKQKNTSRVLFGSSVLVLLATMASGAVKPGNAFILSSAPAFLFALPFAASIVFMTQKTKSARKAMKVYNGFGS